MFSVCVLLYGDYPDLARRCLCSIVRSADWGLVSDLRVGMNDVSPATLEVAGALLMDAAQYTRVYSYRPERNVGKYPLMRRMLHDPGLPLAQYVMWFDDDSFIDPPRQEWWQCLSRHLAEVAPDMVGSVYTLTNGFKKSQLPRMRAQPWHVGKPEPRGHTPFATGGWWCLSSEIVKKHSWPFPEIHHRGGDAVLGELIHQQGYKLSRYNTGVMINYDKERGGESCAVRRGMNPPWVYEVEPDPNIHDFECRVVAHVAV